jgi:GNAT superfamily N-acetyltransferase
VRILKRSPGHQDAAVLLRAFYDEQVSRYGFADPVELDPGEFAAPAGGFVVVYLAGVPAGCGGWRWHDRAAGVAEIKKAYVVPAARGMGTGRALLSWLERQALAAGAVRAILETGVRNTAALRLFASLGYQPIKGYVPGRNPAINRAFARDLVTGAGPAALASGA